MSTQATEGTFQGAGDIELSLRSWQPESRRRGIIVISHGFKAHGGMYEWVAAQFNAEGYAVYCADLRGHGKSAGARYDVETFDDYVADLAATVRLIRTREGTALPLFLLGHSAGGVIGCLYALDFPREIAGFICEDFAYALPPPAVALALLKGLSHLAPHAHLLNLKDEDFSRDPVFVENMRKDPLAINTPGTVQLLAELIRANERLKKAFSRITVPLLVLHGTADHIAKIQGSQELFEMAGSQDKALETYDGHYHDLLNDLGKEKVMADILRWTNARAATTETRERTPLRAVTTGSGPGPSTRVVSNKSQSK